MARDGAPNVGRSVGVVGDGAGKFWSGVFRFLSLSLRAKGRCGLEAR